MNFTKIYNRNGIFLIFQETKRKKYLIFQIHVTYQNPLTVGIAHPTRPKILQISLMIPPITATVGKTISIMMVKTANIFPETILINPRHLTYNILLATP